MSPGKPGTACCCRKRYSVVHSAVHSLPSRMVVRPLYLAVLCTSLRLLALNRQQLQNTTATVSRWPSQELDGRTKSNKLLNRQSRFQLQMLLPNLHSAYLDLPRSEQFRVGCLLSYRAKEL